ncbi:filament-like plant protein [Quillaja saponaria]|uniref:Filament-like plant protein n=1 Tax=Quillaja saponaria TaxID=32244 RepID=A0AAD7PJE3_QUISA|nr:filament-like plant protein [Quillaja saponaria]
MDRRSWLWRRKSSEKSPGETESSGSVSSHSERFSDDQAYPSQTMQSPEVTSKAASNDEVTDNMKTLTEKLSAALSEISAKEDSVQQHAKVAEEAVSGWEKAENEVLSLKQQLESANKRNSALEDRVTHLDGALKECVRELRQAREEQDKKIHEVVSNKTYEWESKRSELEGKISDLDSQLQNAKADAAASISSDLHQRLEAVEKENLAIKLELHSRYEELEFRIIERDLSTQAAETASKQHLDSIKKVAKLEAECRRLKATARKAFPTNDHKSLTASSVYVDSFTDSRSDSGERLIWASTLVTKSDQFKNKKALGTKLMVPSIEISLMDDFLDMERLAALPDSERGRFSLEVGPVSDQPNGNESSLKAELEAMIHRTAELEEKVEKMEADRVEVKMVLTECQEQLDLSQGRLKEAELKIAEMENQLATANKSKLDTYEELKVTKVKNEFAESELRVVQAEVEKLVRNISSLEVELEKERALSAEHVAKCRKLEDELSRMKHEAELQHEAEILRRKGINGELKLNQEKELAVAASKFAECQKTIASLGRQLESLAKLEDFLLESENPLGQTCEDNTQSNISGKVPLNLQPSESNLSKADIKSSVSLKPVVAHEKNRNGFGKLFPRSSSASRTRTH